MPELTGFLAPRQRAKWGETMNDMSSPNMDAGELMRRVRAEIERGQERASSGLRAPDTRRDVIAEVPGALVDLPSVATEIIPPPPLRINLPEPRHSSSRLPVPTGTAGNYRLADLLHLDGDDLVEAAYEVIMKRAADPDGLSCYVDMLRRGATKTEVLGRIRGSLEGRRQGVHIEGLAAAYALDRVMRVPVLGHALQFIGALCSLAVFERRQRRIASELAYRISLVDRHATQATKLISNSLMALQRSHDSLGRLLGSASTRAHVDAIERNLSGSIAALRSIQSALGGFVDRERLDLAISDVREEVQALERKSVCREEFESSTREALGVLIGIEGSKADAQDLRDLRAALDGAISHIKDVAEAKLERTEVLALRSEINSALRATQNEMLSEIGRVERGLEVIKQLKLDREEASTLKEQLAAAVESASANATTALNAVMKDLLALQESKADRSETADLRSNTMELRSELRSALSTFESNSQSSINLLRQAFEALNDNKADRLDIANARAELIATISAALSELRADTEKMVEGGARKIAALENLKAGVDALDAIKEELTRAIEKSRGETLGLVGNALAPIETRAQDLKRNVLDQERRVGLLLEEARKRFPEPISISQIGRMLVEEDHRLDAMYASFEDQFRGTRSDIRQRQSVYLPYIHALSKKVRSAGVLDLACGRGEWLELLRDEGIDAAGVDLNRVTLSYCRDLDLRVFEADILDYLRDQKPNSIGAITSFHVIEHLPHKKFIALIDEMHRVLRPGGLVILETPNPRNVLVGSCNFYLDPTHINPIPPDLSRYLMEARGFVRVEIMELHPRGPDFQISEGAAQVVNALNQLMNSPQDYGVLARKA